MLNWNIFKNIHNYVEYKKKLITYVSHMYEDNKKRIKNFLRVN